MCRSRGLARPPWAVTGSGASALLVERRSYGAAVLGRGSPCAIEGWLSLGSLVPRAPSSVRRIRSASLLRMNGVARSNSTRPPPPVHARRSSGSNTIDSFLGGDDAGGSVTTQVRNRTVSWMSHGATPFVRPSSGPSGAPCLRGPEGAVPPMGRGAGACSPRPHRPRDRRPVGGADVLDRGRHHGRAPAAGGPRLLGRPRSGRLRLVVGLEHPAPQSPLGGRALTVSATPGSRSSARARAGTARRTARWPPARVVQQ